MQAASAALAALVAGDVHAKRALMAAGGMLALAEVLFRSASATAGILEADRVLAALVDATASATLQRCALPLAEGLSLAVRHLLYRGPCALCSHCAGQVCWPPPPQLSPRHAALAHATKSALSTARQA